MSDVSDNERQVVTMHRFNCLDYKWMEVAAHASNMWGLPFLRDIDQNHKNVLYQSSLDHGFDHRKGKMTITFVTSVCTFESVDDMIEQDGSRLVLRVGIALGIVDGCHHRECFLEI